MDPALDLSITGTLTHSPPNLPETLVFARRIIETCSFLSEQTPDPFQRT